MQIKEDPVSGQFVALPETDHEERLLSMAAVTRASLKTTMERPVLAYSADQPRSGSVLLSGEE